MARPTRKAVYLTVGAGVLFLIGTNIQAGWLYVLGASLLGAVAAGLVLPRLSLRRLSFERTAPATLVAGEESPVELLQTGWSRSGGLLLASDHFAGSETPLILRDQGVIKGRVTAMRGVYDGGVVTVTSGFPFGTGRASREFRIGGRYVVHPKWVPLAGFPLLEAASFPNESLHDRRRKGSGVDFYGIREYRPGDSLRHIHWRSTARRGTPLVREYEEQLASRAGIFIDNVTANSAITDPQLELAISAAASVALYALDAGHPVSVACEGASPDERHLLEPGRIELLDWMAELRGGDRTSLVELAERSIEYVRGRSTNILVFQSLWDAADQAKRAASLLQAQGTRVIAIVVSARTFGVSDAMDQKAEGTLIDELHAEHIGVFTVDPERSLQECLSAPIAA